MSDSDSFYRAWTPASSPWSQWVKPVLFASMGDPVAEAPASTIASWHAAPTRDGRTAIVADLPGAEGVDFGLACAAKGWRPVPLYNALPDPLAIVDMDPVIRALRAGARVLDSLTLTTEAGPVFLLDARRRTGPFFAPDGAFDNRSVCFAWDFPSASFLREQGIARVLLVQRTGRQPQLDLLPILRDWHAAELRVAVQPPDEPATAEECDLRPPSLWRRLQLRLLLWLSLHPRTGGVFGEFVEHGSGG